MAYFKTRYLTVPIGELGAEKIDSEIRTMLNELKRELGDRGPALWPASVSLAPIGGDRLFLTVLAEPRPSNIEPQF